MRTMLLGSVLLGLSAIFVSSGCGQSPRTAPGVTPGEDSHVRGYSVQQTSIGERCQDPSFARIWAQYCGGSSAGGSAIGGPIAGGGGGGISTGGPQVGAGMPAGMRPAQPTTDVGRRQQWPPIERRPYTRWDWRDGGWRAVPSDTSLATPTEGGSRTYTRWVRRDGGWRAIPTEISPATPAGRRSMPGGSRGW